MGDLFYEMDQHDRRAQAYRKMIKEIKRFPTTFERVHESVFRSYQILEKVKELLEKNTAPDIILELVKEMEEEEEVQEAYTGPMEPPEEEEPITESMEDK